MYGGQGRWWARPSNEHPDAMLSDRYSRSPFNKGASYDIAPSTGDIIFGRREDEFQSGEDLIAYQILNGGGREDDENLNDDVTYVGKVAKFKLVIPCPFRCKITLGSTRNPQFKNLNLLQ